MSYLSWNCQGLGSDLTIRSLRGIIKSNRPAIVFLMETKTKHNRLKKCSQDLGFSESFGVDSLGQAGGLCLWWDNSVEVQVLAFSKNLIDTEITEKGGGKRRRISWIYGTPNREEKNDFWSWIGNSLQPGSIPWMCIGDFNELIWEFEKKGGRAFNLNSRRYLQEFMNQKKLLDLGFQGQAFTWRGRRAEGVLIQERLDRGLINYRWQEAWPCSVAIHLPAVGSDHCPILILTEGRQEKVTRPFKFEAYWVTDPECREVIHRSWNMHNGGGSVSCWNKKQRRCRYDLRKWSRGKFSNARLKIDTLNAELEVLQRDWEENVGRIERVKLELNETWGQEEKFWKQRSRITWLKEGDSNTAFFHHSTLQRRRRNRVSKIKGVNGLWGEGDSQVRKAFEDYFKDIFSAGRRRDLGDSLAFITPVITGQMNISLCRPVSDEEIKEAAFQLGANKAPGPDGFSGVFYHHYWDIIREDLSRMVKAFFHEEFSVHGLNMTEIALIPKVPNPEAVTQFRPIALCNFTYKIISKILANRLKPLLAVIISPQQSAFIPGRQIQDNILLAHEAFHALKLRKKTKIYEMGVKLDMNKAYDRIEWDFLKQVLEKMGFDEMWVRLVMRCITSVRLTVLLNGQSGNSFKPSRGLRQGDPISPYLFILVSDVLSTMLNKAVERGFVHGFRFSRDGPSLSHLFFADDSILFLKATERNCRAVASLLTSYCQASGQVINYDKSSVFFSPNTPQQLRERVGHILQVNSTENPGKYLGLPTMWGRSKREAMNFVKERIMGKVEGWKQKLLTQAGREVLIKAVAQAIPTYPMTVLLFPGGLCRELDGILAKFWWGGNEDKDELHWISWVELGMPKLEGGMGFRNLYDFNLALLAKQSWRLLTEPNSFWGLIMKSRYFPSCDFLKARKGARASWAWASLLEGRKVVNRGSKWQILNGTKVRIWADKWLPLSPDGKLNPIQGALVDEDAVVSDLIDPITRSWDLSSLNGKILDKDARWIRALPVGGGCEPDRLVWPFNRTGAYSVKSGYNLIHPSSYTTLKYMRASGSHCVSKKVWKLIWCSILTPKIKHFMWRAIKGCLPTKALLFRRHLGFSPLCPVCEKEPETIEHLFFYCHWTSKVWFGSLLGYRVDLQCITTFDDWLLGVTGQLDKETLRWVLIHISYLCWGIWRSRCNYIFEGKQVCPSQTIAWSRCLAVELLEVVDLNGDVVGDPPLPEVTSIPRWLSPSYPFLKLNVDATWDRKTSIAGLGAVIRDQHGNFIRGAGKVRLASSPIEAEAFAAVHGLMVASHLGPVQLECESDSRELIQSVKGITQNCRWSIYPILAALKEKCGLFGSCSWKWIPRMANRAADAAAKEAKRKMCDEVWISRPPSSLVFVLQNDGLPCPPLG
ncbi:unnamed protein product [Prunus brigantina]